MRANCALLAAVLITALGCDRSTTVTSSPSQLPPIAPALVKNADLKVAYIGTDRCGSCHRDAEATYRHTAHSLALAELDIDSEPPDGEFDDPKTQKHYRSYRKNGRLYHEESILDSAGKSLILCDLPVKYVIGSGHFSRSYIIEREGFLYQSPITWYRAPQAWKLSPGYDRLNRGFARSVEVRCLFCHSGRAEPIEQSPQRVALPSLAIDCERCHGPGELHARKWQGVVASSPKHAERDDTIFNPKKFDRQLGEDVCAQCHLQSAATVARRGRKLTDFRPGQKLSDFVAHYVPQSPNLEMKVVGHVEQLRLSRCYQADQRMTCLTCHDPHADDSPKEKQSRFRQTCLTCHTEQSCRATIESRRAPTVQDDCIQCHMPRGPTDIPHLAFTHHRIGIHKPSTRPVAARADVDELVLMPGSPSTSPQEELRNLGLGSLLVSDSSDDELHFRTYRVRAAQLLKEYQRLKIKDPEVDAALARVHWNIDPQQTLFHAHAVAAAKDPSPTAWTTACVTLGTTYYSLNQLAEARVWLERASALRPAADASVMLSNCLYVAGEKAAAVAASRRACELVPDQPRYLQQLIDRLTDAGELAEAESLRLRWEEISKYRSRMDAISEGAEKQ
jgi:predicted CXXCH cytochrome family protein